MKHVTVLALAGVGACALLFAALRLTVHAVAPDYDKAAKEQFGSSEATTAILALYSKIEAAGNDAALKVVEDRHSGFPKARRIPRSWLTPVFSEVWGAVLDQEIIEPGDVLAYYSSTDALIAIEFTGTRYGCFVSRDARLCPPEFRSLHRLAEKPLYITSRISEGEE